MTPRHVSRHHPHAATWKGLLPTAQLNRRDCLEDLRLVRRRDHWLHVRITIYISVSGPPHESVTHREKGLLTLSLLSLNGKNKI